MPFLAHGLATIEIGATSPRGVINYNLDQLDPGRIASGVFGSRPAFGNANRYYYSTDTNALYYDNGSAWVLLAGGGGAPPDPGIVYTDGASFLTDDPAAESGRNTFTYDPSYHTMGIGTAALQAAKLATKGRDSIGTVIYAGGSGSAGDLVLTGIFSIVGSHDFIITIDSNGTPDTVTINVNTVDILTGVPIDVAAQVLSFDTLTESGLLFQLPTTGNTLGSSWSFTALSVGPLYAVSADQDSGFAVTNRNTVIFNNTDFVSALQISTIGSFATAIQAESASGFALDGTAHTANGAGNRMQNDSGPGLVVIGQGSDGISVTGREDAALFVGGQGSPGAGLYCEAANGVTGYFRSSDSSNTQPTVVIHQRSSSAARLLEFRESDDTVRAYYDVNLQRLVLDHDSSGGALQILNGVAGGGAIYASVQSSGPTLEIHNLGDTGFGAGIHVDAWQGPCIECGSADSGNTSPTVLIARIGGQTTNLLSVVNESAQDLANIDENGNVTTYADSWKYVGAVDYGRGTLPSLLSGLTGVGYTAADNGAQLVIPLDVRVGDIVDIVAVKYSGSNASSGVKVTVRKRDESGTTTSYTTIGTQQTLHHSGVVVDTYSLGGTPETINANFSYDLLIEADVPALQTVNLYAIGWHTTQRGL